MLICLITLIVSLLHIIKWKDDSDNTFKQLDNIQEITKIDKVVDDDDVEIIEQEEDIDEFNPYWDYIKMNLINVDFQEL